MAACVRQDRVFISRLIGHLKSLPQKGMHLIPVSVKKDIYWWAMFCHFIIGCP